MGERGDTGTRTRSVKTPFLLRSWRARDWILSTLSVPQHGAYAEQHQTGARFFLANLGAVRRGERPRATTAERRGRVRACVRRGKDERENAPRGRLQRRARRQRAARETTTEEKTKEKGEVETRDVGARRRAREPACTTRETRGRPLEASRIPETLPSRRERPNEIRRERVDKSCVRKSDGRGAASE